MPFSIGQNCRQQKRKKHNRSTKEEKWTLVIKGKERGTGREKRRREGTRKEKEERERRRKGYTSQGFRQVRLILFCNTR